MVSFQLTQLWSPLWLRTGLISVIDGFFMSICYICFAILLQFHILTCPFTSQIDSSKISQLDKDFILLSHLIPCCQHYVMGYKPEFEQEMNKRLRKGESLSGFRREAWSTFIIWLLIHPRNAPILNALVLPSLLYYNGKRPNTGMCHSEVYSCAYFR